MVVRGDTTIALEILHKEIHAFFSKFDQGSSPKNGKSKN